MLLNLTRTKLSDTCPARRLLRMAGIFIAMSAIGGLIARMTRTMMINRSNIFFVVDSISATLNAKGCGTVDTMQKRKIKKSFAHTLLAGIRDCKSRPWLAVASILCMALLNFQAGRDLSRKIFDLIHWISILAMLMNGIYSWRA